MKFFLLSNISLTIGILAILAGIANPNGSLLVMGPVIVLGVLSYQSAKKRKLNLVKNTILRRFVEGVLILATFLLIFLQKNLAELMYEDSVTNILVPIWVWGAYFNAIFSKPKQEAIKSIEK